MNATATFFDDLTTRGHDPVLEKANGAMLVELTHETGTRRWLVTIDRGNVTVVEDPGAATSTCTLRTSAATFELIACGQGNAMAAALRGDLLIEGDVQLLLLFQRLFPGPPGARHPREFVQAGRSE